MAVDRFLDAALSIAKSDWTVGQTKEMAAMFRRFHVIGLSDAAAKANSWADECGSSSGGDGYRNLATAILSLANQ